MVAGIGLVYLERVRGARHRARNPAPSTLPQVAVVQSCLWHRAALAVTLAAVSDQTVCCCCHRQATEYYYDEGAKQLYYFSNATHGAPPTETFVAVRTSHPKHQA